MGTVGRPPNPTVLVCKNRECNNLAAPNQVYCSRECAPFGNLCGRDPMKKPQYMPMDPRRRELFHKVINESVHAQEITVYLYHLDQAVHCNAMLEWLIKQGITGDNFIGWIRNNKFTPLQVIREIVKRANRNRVQGDIVAGRDYKV